MKPKPKANQELQRINDDKKDMATAIAPTKVKEVGSVGIRKRLPKKLPLAYYPPEKLPPAGCAQGVNMTLAEFNYLKLSITSRPQNNMSMAPFSYLGSLSIQFSTISSVSCLGHSSDSNRSNLQRLCRLSKSFFGAHMFPTLPQLILPSRTTENTKVSHHYSLVPIRLALIDDSVMNGVADSICPR
ncbi:hypothetical protein Cgig2_032382 [Carnegiea gigantea]|uniref:Uncharacterized protein n=1 Tax=Carnegiea gigantea TaxID=171969 RepID=A0A9Q1GPS2_9CARY|nr:hypothetical protein Cgig2_032382 [Carnegiea gigantea]